MRYIKFRGKTQKYGWVCGCLLRCDRNPDTVIIQSTACNSPLVTESWYVDPASVGLVSMSKDGHGDIISEGDIIEGMLGKRGVVKFGKHSIKGDSSTPDYYLEGFYCEDEDLTQLRLIGFCEIIGNVFENPDLLTI